ncbi:DUF4912 domain-containing protein [Paenibacillus hexagrammi]|uniref:DUF4912 domain-containing protein n=1 Tax=Paenibacillus hexagrammi TaxID=2908839 RepID=A0ABY3SK20_9BACL|nr:DUF4912 domain-containing protein [Paenibacillus sp. YPD9-1]UJF34394.1 DUF4912 domain-containing protein [Paenibacillus sp. YPD9-1]
MKSLPSASFEVPDRYNKDLLHLMVRDAHTLYVYWEISDRRRWLVAQHFECDYGMMPKVLRLYDITDTYFNGSNAHWHRDTLTTPEANNWYLQGLQADRTYVVDIGTYTWDHQFIPLLRSGCAATPKDTEAVWGEPIRGVVPQAQAAHVHSRIVPQLFENLQPYTPYAR